MRTFEIYVHNDCDKPKDEKYTNHAQAIMICNAISAMREKRRAELNLKGPRAKYKEETMKPEKEASKCQEEIMDERISRIVEDKLEEALNDFEKILEIAEKYNSKEDDSEKGPAPELTQKENNILKGLHYLGWSWIARDKNGELYIFKLKPEKKENIWANGWEGKNLERAFPNDEPQNDLFLFIQWQNDEPTLIANLIDWSDDKC